MLIHGRLLVTEHGFMLDEVKSLLQKSLRRNETDLIKKATKELTCGKRDQLQWKAIVTFLFEDHCLNHVTVLEKIERLHRNGNKLGCIEILSGCYTCRYSACNQVVAISDEYRKYDAFWDCQLPVDPVFNGLVTKAQKQINCERLLTLIVKFWKCNDTKVLTSLFGLVNMAAKVENRTLSKAGVAKLLLRDVKKPSLHQLVLSVLYHHGDNDEYTKSLLMVCFRFAIIPEVPQGLILFSVLSQKIYKNTILEKPVPELGLQSDFWKDVGVLDRMPDWAVDKHTFRGKFGKSSAELFQKKFKQYSFSAGQLEEFHGIRPKVGIPYFFDVGCICSKDILPDNPIWEQTKAMYLQQKPSLQKSAKMTKMYYNEIRKNKSVVFQPTNGTDISELISSDEDVNAEKGKRKRDSSLNESESRKCKKQETLFACLGEHDKDRLSASTSGLSAAASVKPNWPLLQLPTGSGKVYTFLNEESRTVWKGPYKSKEKMMLCKFYHRAMKDIFGDQHTLSFEEKGSYIIFPLLSSRQGQVRLTKRAFYDCIAKREVSEEEGVFVERDALGLVQLHKLPVAKLRALPVSIWGHFAFRYVLNIGDSGIYNAIAIEDLSLIYGIDMEENRKQVKGNDVINMMFTKLPRREFVQEIKQAICENVEEFVKLIDRDFDIKRLSEMYVEHELKDETGVCKKRLAALKEALERHCQTELGV